MTFPPQPVSPLDGRYSSQIGPIGDHLSEAGLNRARVHVEVEWLLFCASHGLFGTREVSETDARHLRDWAANFGQAEIDWLAEKERVTRHDVKAVEYLVRERLSEQGLDALSEAVHIACTSEDINNLSYALTIQAAVRDVWLPKFDGVIAQLRALAEEHREQPMLSHTHGQPATPTTLGKEFAVFAWRLSRQRDRVASVEPLGKFAGATATFSAHPAAYWPTLASEFVAGLGLTWNPLTTQIESHDWQAELFAGVSHAGRILHNLATDVWTYISMGYFTQIPVAGATGSSTMPHKINPIRFENAEANLELASAVLDSLASTLVTSRLQRDLTDSSAQRNIGVGFGHSMLALDNLSKGLGEFSVSADSLQADLDGNWEVLAEAIQTVIRAEVLAGRSSITDPYALLKDLTRGQRVDRDALVEFVDALDIGEDAKARLRELRPETYTGLASDLVDRLP